MDARLILADEPGAWIEFRHRGRPLKARMDPIQLGPEMFAMLFENPRAVWRLMDEKSKIRAMTSDPFGEYTTVLLEDYLRAVGLSFKATGLLIHALENLGRLEVDLLRLGLDVRDWLNPEGSLSSRRVALLVEDLRDRPETRLGALVHEVLPLSKEAMVGAQLVSQQVADKEFVHPFLRSPADLEAEAAAMREDAATRERIKGIRPAEIAYQAPVDGSFSSAQEESSKALADLLAQEH